MFRIAPHRLGLQESTVHQWNLPADSFLAKPVSGMWGPGGSLGLGPSAAPSVIVDIGSSAAKGGRRRRFRQLTLKFAAEVPCVCHYTSRFSFFGGWCEKSAATCGPKAADVSLECFTVWHVTHKYECSNCKEEAQLSRLHLDRSIHPHRHIRMYVCLTGSHVNLNSKKISSGKVARL